MKKKKIRAIRLVVAVVILAILSPIFFNFGRMTLKSFSICWKMSSLTQESSYYQSLNDWQERDRGVVLVKAKRAELLNSEDEFTSWYANKAPLLKIIVLILLGVITVIVGFVVWLAWLSIWYNRKIYAKNIRKLIERRCNA